MNKTERRFKDSLDVRPWLHARTSLGAMPVRPQMLWTYDQRCYGRTSTTFLPVFGTIERRLWGSWESSICSQGRMILILRDSQRGWRRKMNWHKRDMRRQDIRDYSIKGTKIQLWWVLLIRFVRFWNYFRGQIVSWLSPSSSAPRQYSSGSEVE